MSRRQIILPQALEEGEGVYEVALMYLGSLQTKYWVAE